MYFNIEQVGKTSAASIPVAIADAVRDNVISQPTRIFATGFGAVGRFAVLHIDPQVVATEHLAEIDRATATPPPQRPTKPHPKTFK